jgi:putative ABC transport system substrate-binding protein
MTTRRQLLLQLSGLVLLRVSPALAQRGDRPARIALLEDGRETSRAHLWAVFRKRLQELGYVEGKSYIIEGRWARADLARLPALAAELVVLKPDVIVSSSVSSAVAAKKATSSIPIVALGTVDPVKSGLVASLARPEGNLTGITSRQGESIGKELEILREIAPKAKSIAFLTLMSNPASMQIFRELQERARPLGVAVKAFDGSNRSSVERAFDAIARERIEAMIVSTTGVLLDQRQQIVDAAARQRIPSVYMRREYVDVGGLMSFSTAFDLVYARGADYVHRILQGTKPSELPFEQVSTFKLVLNLKAARALGLKIPESLRVRVDEAIE